MVGFVHHGIYHFFSANKVPIKTAELCFSVRFLHLLADWDFARKAFIHQDSRPL